jgi:hypothetical protein
MEGSTTPQYMDAYSMLEAAEALGRDALNFKRWVQNGVIPPPVLHETRRGFKQYSYGELEVLRRELLVHWREFTYLSARHTDTVSRIWSAIQTYRVNNM